MSFKQRFDRARAVVGIVGALAGAGGDPVLKNTTPGLTDQYGKYAKEVRLPATRREIERELDRAARDKKNRQDSTSLQLTKKDLKNLK